MKELASMHSNIIMASPAKLIITPSLSMKVNIQTKKWIKPATPTPPQLQKLKLSSVDQLQPPMYVQLIAHFNNKISQVQTTPPDDHDEKVAQLEESLSKILTLYYPYAGRYDNVDESSSSVSCKDQGTKFVVATVNRKLAEFSDGKYDKAALVSGLENVVLGSDVAWAPVFSVQVNVFSCGGLALGLSFLHKVSDIFTFSAFMDAWATASRLGSLDRVVAPNFRFSSYLPPKHSLKSSKPPPEEESNTQTMMQPRFVTKRFVFTKRAILKLKSAVAKSDQSEPTATNYTRVQLITALITRSLVKIESAKGAKPRPFAIFHTMNIRPRLTLPIEEENVCGDFYTLSTIRGVEHESWEVRELAELIRNSIKDVASDIGDVKDWGELGKKVEKKYMEFYEEEGKGREEVNMMTFSSWCRFPLNEVDFGWGPPSGISTLPSSFAITHLIDHKSSDVDDDGGIEAWVCLKEDDMACFQNKPDILEYALSIPTFAKAGIKATS